MDFSELAIKGRDAFGNILTKNAVHKIVMKEKGVSTLGGRKIWFDEDVLRLNADGRGRMLGEFSGHDRLLIITRSGKYRLSTFDLENHFEDDLHILEKYNSKKVYSVVFWDADQNFHYLKRFILETTAKLTSFIGDNPESRLIQVDLVNELEPLVPEQVEEAVDKPVLESKVPEQKGPAVSKKEKVSMKSDTGSGTGKGKKASGKVKDTKKPKEPTKPKELPKPKVPTKPKEAAKAQKPDITEVKGTAEEKKDEENNGQMILEW